MTTHATSGPGDGWGGEDEHRAAPPRGGGRVPLAWTIVLMAVAAGVLYFGLPRLAGLEDTWGQYRPPIVPGVISYMRLLRTVRSWDASGEPSR